MPDPYRKRDGQRQDQILTVKGMVRDRTRSDSDKLKMKMFLKSAFPFVTIVKIFFFKLVIKKIKLM